MNKLIKLVKGDIKSVQINIVGIMIWSIIWFVFDIGTLVSRRNNNLVYIYWGLISIFILNIYMSDEKEGSYDDECRIKTDLERQATTLIGIIITVALCAELLRETPSLEVKGAFYTLLTLSLVSVLGVLFHISVPKTASEIRIARKAEAVCLNISLTLLFTAIAYIISEKNYNQNFIETN